MNFLKKIRNSIYSPAFYLKIPQSSFGSAIGYILLLSLFLTIIQSIVPIWIFSTKAQTEINKFFGQTKNIYPSDLEIKIQKGKLSTNVQEPYFVPIPRSTDMKNETPKNIENFIVIDTKTPFSIDQFNQYKTFAWATENSLITIDSNNSTRIYDLSKASNVVINKTLVASLIDKFSPWLKLITPLAVIGILLGIYMTYAFRLIYLLLLALIILLLTKLLKKPLKYGQSYKVGLHAITLGFFIDLIFGWIHFSGFPFMFTIVSLSVVLVNFLSRQKENPLPPS